MPSIMFALLVSISAAPPPDAADRLHPVLLPVGGSAGALVGGIAGSGIALGLALAAQAATGDEVTAGARTLNQLTTFGTLVAPALLSVGGAVVGAGLAGGLVGALTVGFGATMGAAVGTGVALATVPLGANAVDAPGGALGATAGIAGVVVSGAAVGAAIAGLVAALTLESGAVDEGGGDDDPDADGPDDDDHKDASTEFALDGVGDRR